MRARRARLVVWRGVVKVARISSGGRKLVSIYSEDLSVEAVLPLGPLASWFKQSESFAFAEATLDDAGVLNIARKLRGRWPTW